MVEYVLGRKIDRALRRQEKKNLKEKHKSLTWVSMLNLLRDYIVEYRGEITVMKEGWRDYIKTL